MTDVSLGDLLGEVTTGNPDEVRPDVLYVGLPPHAVWRNETIGATTTRSSRLRHLSKHSPTGFSWGYGGSGPAELARCLLIDALGPAGLCPTCLGRRWITFTDEHSLRAVPAPPGRASECESCYTCDAGYGPLVERNYQALKFQVVARWPQDEQWTITRREILQWLSDHLGSRVEDARCRHCGHRLYSRTGVGRYAWTDVADGTDTLGSGSECPANEHGHEPEES